MNYSCSCIIDCLYCKAGSGVNYVANSASGFHAFLVADNYWCSGDSCLDKDLFDFGRLSICAQSCALEQVFGILHVAIAFPFVHDGFVDRDNGQMVGLYERQTVLWCLLF